MNQEEIENMTNDELLEFIKELHSKFAKLVKVANKLAIEMDSIDDQYNIAKEIGIKRGMNLI